MTVTVTDRLLHQLVSGSHAEGTTRLAVAAAIEHNDHTLLLAVPGDDFDPTWELPADIVLPGESLLDTLCRAVTATTGLNVTDVTGYTGHHDHHTDNEITRTFIFTVTATDPDQVCRWAGHHWHPDPITATGLLGDIDDRTTRTGPTSRTVDATSTQRLASALQANAQGVLCVEAATHILINHRSWLHRKDFVDNFIDTITTSPQPLGGSHDTALVDWTAALAALDAGRLPCSSSEDQLLRIAASLARGIPVDLADTLTGLDHTNTALVAHAIYHAAGHRP
jgi:ADP-ribose pyrophosphatase YjhB (NUDIX family)